MRVAIVMTYFDRFFQLCKTLETLQNIKDLFVVIINDNDKISLTLPTKYKNINISIINVINKVWINPEPAYNLGIIEALKFDPEIIILQNAECYHVGNIVEYSRNNITEFNYLSFACFSIDKNHTFNETFATNKTKATQNGQNGWYNHSIYNPVAYDFCSAIKTSNLIKLNGYDERLSQGWCYGDNYLLHRIKLLGLEVKIVDSPFVVHQWHYYDSIMIKQRRTKISINKKIYSELLLDQDYKAKHLITKDL